ncbi:uncharacterized protein [Clytia hemisphaerica]|uniref:uncharacterized protein isoform X5 n=1 Tax=Clytia hemisphaerica TaxID=252671 RepID=UPI0034D501A0
MSSKQNLPTQCSSSTVTITTTTKNLFPGVGQILSTGSEKEESSQENAKNSKEKMSRILPSTALTWDNWSKHGTG